MDSDLWNRIRANARQQTDDQFSSTVSNLTRLTSDEIKQLTPTAVDKENFAQLMAIMQDATKSNQQKAEAIKNITALTDIALRLLVTMGQKMV